MEGKIIVSNRRARHDFHIEETYECGIALHGTEVKSLRGGQGNLKESYGTVRGGEVFLVGMHISPYEQGNRFNKDPLREKKLLLHKSQIRKLTEWTQQKGFTLVPLSLYLKHGRVKVELGVARGKKLYDKRDTIAARDVQREREREAVER